MIYQPQLTIQLRQRQLQDIYGNSVVFTGSNPLSLVASICAGQPGALPGAPPLLPTDYTDYTDFCQGIDKLELTWSTTETPQGTTPAGQFMPKMGVSGTLTFERDAADFLRQILIEDVAAPLNQIEVQITDIASGSYTGYVIKSSQLSWCEFNALCTYDLNLKQEDYYTQCIERTMIADNWQGWFQPQPGETFRGSGVQKKHPRFSYCTEHRPNGTLVVLWYMLSLLMAFSVIVAAIIVVLDLIKAIINAIVSFIDFLGGSLSFLPITDPTDAFTSIGQLFIEAAGCGREHPAPLIRDYITNVCLKCGVSVNATTADIFFAPSITIQKSDGVTYTEPNPHYNAVLFYPQVVRGIRRFASINLFGTSVKDTTTFYDPNNQPVWALSDLLDYVKHIYNAQWKIQSAPGAVTGTTEYYLWFKRKDWYQNQPPLYDFSKNGADRPKIVEGICYEPTDFTLPASMNGLYKDDPADKCGHENARNMNGDPLSFNNTVINPLFHGILDKQSGFGATKFRLDGSTSDYIYDAGQVVLNGSILNPFLGGQMDTVFCFVRKYCDYAILLQGETTALPKILIWDGQSNNTSTCDPSDSSSLFLNARAMRDIVYIGSDESGIGTPYSIGKSAWPGTVPGIGLPDINTNYPQQVCPSPSIYPTLVPPTTVPELLTWNYEATIVPPPPTPPFALESYPPETAVIGHSLSFAPPVPGKYTVQNIIGTVISQQAAILVNYPMYFNPYYKDTLWDWFHWIDDPYRYPRLHKNWNLKIPLCNEDLVKLNVLGDGLGVNLLQSVQLDVEFYNLGVITEISVGYDTGAAGGTPGTGQFIQLKGYV